MKKLNNDELEAGVFCPGRLYLSPWRKSHVHNLSSSVCDLLRGRLVDVDP
jgi:hypothetical protein